MNYKAVITEDNPVDAEVLEDYLRKYFPEITIAARATSLTQAKKMVVEQAPDILFMDVELTDGKSVELLDSLNSDNIQLIFITSYDVFAIDAIRANAVDYIVKPVDDILLKKAVMKAIERIEKNKRQTVAADRSKINLPTAEGYMFLDTATIIRAEANGNYTLIVTNVGKQVLASKTLLYFERELPEANFMRVHDSCVVNRHFISEYIKGKRGKIKLTDGFICNISDSRRDTFLQWMNLR